MDVSEREAREGAAHGVGGAGSGQLPAAGDCADGEVSLGLGAARGAEARTLGRLLVDLTYTALVDIEDRRIEPELRVGLGEDERTGKQALPGVDDAHVDIVGVHRVADDDRPGLARGDDVDASAGGFGGSHILDAQHRVIAGDARLRLHGLERSEVEEELAELAGIGGVAPLGHDPVGGLAIEARLGLVRLADADLRDVVDRAFEPRKDGGAGDRVLAGLAAGRHPRGEREDDDTDGEKNADAACSHESLPFLPGTAAGRRRRKAATRSAASAKAPGMAMMSMNLSSVPSLSMSLTRPACTARNCLRICSLSVSKCSISCCCAGVRISADLSLRLDCSRVSCCSVCCSSCCSCASCEWKRASARRFSASTRRNGRVKPARPRTLMRSELPARLSSAFNTRVPLPAMACSMRCPKSSSSRTQRKSDSRSVSAKITRLSGFTDALRSRWPAGNVTPGGGPSGNAVFTMPVTRAPMM